MEWVRSSDPKASCKDLPELVDAQGHAKDFYEKMHNYWHKKIYDYGNENAWATDFIAPPDGNSLNYSDNVHLCYFSDHGGNDGNTMSMHFSSKGHPCHACSCDMKLGAKKLKWLVMDCCDMVLNTTKSHLKKVWFTPASGIHMIFGLVGIANMGWWTRNLGGNFADDIGEEYIPLGPTWVSEAHSTYYDNYPIAIAYGSTKDETALRLGMECLALRDYDVTAPNWMAWLYWTGDDPNSKITDD